MEIYEMTIKSEESRNYHKFLFRLKSLGVVGWIKAYISSVIFMVMIWIAGFVFDQNVALKMWTTMPLWTAFVAFAVIFILSALRRAKNTQLNALLQKYFLNNIPQEFLTGRVRLKKIKVDKDRILIFYRVME